MKRPQHRPAPAAKPILRTIAGLLASSRLLARGKRLFDLNSIQWHMPLSKWDKLLAGGYIILEDYAEGRFPPTYNNQETTHQAEIHYYESMPGVSLAENVEGHARKPFWGAENFERYSRSVVRLLRVFDGVGLRPGAWLLELGCGPGWLAEFLALAGYSVVGTTLAPNDIEIANRRVAAFRARGLTNELNFKASAMESVNETLGEKNNFDGVFVFEALHHAFDWRKAIQASFRCLKEGGWLVLANEPNVLHTFVSYRVARLSNTHEIGLNKARLIEEMYRCGFSEVKIISPRFNNFVSPHWIAARKPIDQGRA